MLVVVTMHLLCLRSELPKSGQGLPGRKQAKAQPRNQPHKHKAKGKNMAQSEN